MPQVFILNDELQYNTYGFRVINAGIDLSRFTQNPVMLNGHDNSNEAVIGKWVNIATNGQYLQATPEFDTEDEAAKRIAGKVDRGFIKACSMGLLFEMDDLIIEPNGKFAMAKCQLIENSIVPVPSNANALRLYVQKNGELQLLKPEEIQLCLSGLPTTTNFDNKPNTMKKVILNVAALMALGLDKHNTTDGVDANLVENAVNELKQKMDVQATMLASAQLALKALQDSANAHKQKAALALVDDAIAQGKIIATAKDEWLKIAETNEALAIATLGALPAKNSLGQQVNNSGANGSDVKTMDEFEKLPLAAQLAFKKENPEAYKQMVS